MRLPWDAPATSLPGRNTSTNKSVMVLMQDAFIEQIPKYLGY